MVLVERAQIRATGQLIRLGEVFHQRQHRDGRVARLGQVGDAREIGLFLQIALVVRHRPLSGE